MSAVKINTVLIGFAPGLNKSGVPSPFQEAFLALFLGCFSLAVLLSSESELDELEEEQLKKLELLFSSSNTWCQYNKTLPYH